MAGILVLRIKRIYFDDILLGNKRIEYRQNSDFFRIRLAKKPTDLYLVCGRALLKMKIKYISLIKKPQKLMNLAFLPTDKIFAIHLDKPYFHRKMP